MQTQNKEQKLTKEQKEKQEYNKLSETDKKIYKAKEKIAIIKQIEKLEKECARLKKNLLTKQEKIEELAKLL